MRVTRLSASTGSDAGALHRPDIVVIDYELGNVSSVVNALEALGARAAVSRNPLDLERADGLVLPGVGAFGDGMANLKRFGLVPVLEDLVLHRKKPLLGICLGMQLLAKTGYEGGEQDGLGWVDAEVIRFDADASGLKVPHVGWNDVTCLRDNPLLGQAGERQTYYFVHSYHLQCRQAELAAGLCEYGVSFPAVIQQDNIWAVQFHPEKSQKYGLNLLANFLALACPSTHSTEETAC